MPATDLFKIEEIPEIHGCNWSVTWPGWGMVRQRYTQARVLNIAFNTNTSTVGVAFEGVHQRVLFLKSQSWLQRRAEDIINYYEMDPIIGLAFPERINAEEFVDNAELEITWNLLKRQHSTEI